MKLDEGRYLNDRLATYLIPTALDAPHIRTILVEAPYSGVAARREGRRRAADGRGRARGRGRDPRRDRRLDPRPARRRRSGSSRRSRPRPRSASGRAPPRERVPVPGQRRARRRSTCPGMRRLLDVLREDLGLTGHEGGLRGRGVRGVLRPARRPGRRCLPRARSARSRAGSSGRSRGSRSRHGSEARSTPSRRPSWSTAPRSAGSARPGMLMAARAYLDGGGGPDDGADPRGDRRQPVPLHGLHEDRGRDRGRRRRRSIEMGGLSTREADRFRRAWGGAAAPMSDCRVLARARSSAASRCSRRSSSGSSAAARQSRRLMPAEPPIDTPRDLFEAYERLAAGADPPDRRGHRHHGRDHRRARDRSRSGCSTSRGSTSCAASPSRRARSCSARARTYTEIRRSALCREHLPALVEAAATIGAAQIQNRGHARRQHRQRLAGGRHAARSCSPPMR